MNSSRGISCDCKGDLGAWESTDCSLQRSWKLCLRTEMLGRVGLIEELWFHLWVEVLIALLKVVIRKCVSAVEVESCDCIKDF